MIYWTIPQLTIEEPHQSKFFWAQKPPRTVTRPSFDARPQLQQNNEILAHRTRIPQKISEEQHVVRMVYRLSRMYKITRTASERCEQDSTHEHQCQAKIWRWSGEEGGYYVTRGYGRAHNPGYTNIPIEANNTGYARHDAAPSFLMCKTYPLHKKNTAYSSGVRHSHRNHIKSDCARCQISTTHTKGENTTHRRQRSSPGFFPVFATLSQVSACVLSYTP